MHERSSNNLQKSVQHNSYKVALGHSKVKNINCF